MRKRKQETMVEPLMLSIPQVCKSLSLGRTKVYELIDYDDLPVVHFGRSVRVSVIALQRWVADREKSA